MCLAVLASIQDGRLCEPSENRFAVATANRPVLVDWRHTYRTTAPLSNRRQATTSIQSMALTGASTVGLTKGSTWASSVALNDRLGASALWTRCFNCSREATIWSRSSSGSMDIPPSGVTLRVFKEFAARMNSRSRVFSRSGLRSGLMTLQSLVSNFNDILLP